MKCGYSRAWMSPCPEEATRGGRCEGHADRTCVVCHAPASRECGVTSQFVCGQDLCPDHHHAPYPGYGHE